MFRFGSLSFSICHRGWLSRCCRTTCGERNTLSLVKYSRESGFQFIIAYFTISDGKFSSFPIHFSLSMFFASHEAFLKRVRL